MLSVSRLPNKVPSLSQHLILDLLTYLLASRASLDWVTIWALQPSWGHPAEPQDTSGKSQTTQETVLTTLSESHGGNPLNQYPSSAVPNLFGTRDWFCENDFATDWGGEGWFGDYSHKEPATWIPHRCGSRDGSCSYENLMPLLIRQKGSSGSHASDGERL